MLASFAGLMLALQLAPSLVLVNGRVWTADPARPWAEAIAVRDGRITAVGQSARIRAMAGADAEVLDAGGRLVIPGFHDAHVHFASGSMRLTEVDHTGACTLEEMAKRIRGWMKEDPAAAWVVGGGWEYTCFSGLPRKEQPDRIAVQLPVRAVRLALEARGDAIRAKTLDGLVQANGEFVGPLAAQGRLDLLASVDRHYPVASVPSFNENRGHAIRTGFGLCFSGPFPQRRRHGAEADA